MTDTVVARTRRSVACRRILLVLIAAVCFSSVLLQVSTRAQQTFRSIQSAHCRLFNTEAVCQQRDKALRLGVTPLHVLADFPFNAVLPWVADLANLIGSGVDVVDSHGATPLHYAARAGNAWAILVLLKRGAKADARDADQRTPLDMLMSRRTHERSIFLAARYLELAASQVRPFPPPAPALQSVLISLGLQSDATGEIISPVRLPQYESVQRIPFSELSVERFIRDFVRTRTPVVMTDALAAFNLTGWRSADVAKACGSMLFDTAQYIPNVTQWAKLQTEVGRSSLSDFMSAHFGQTPAGTRSEDTHSRLRIFDAAFVKECPTLGGIFGLPQHVASDLRRTWDYEPASDSITHPSLFACPSGVKSGLHIDSGENAFWMVILEGKKTYRFVNSQHMHLLKTEEMHDNSYNHYLFDLFDDGANVGDDGTPWHRRWSAEALAMVGGWEASIERGDMIYVPQATPHQVITLADTISFSANFVEPELSQHTLKYCCMHANTADGVSEADCARVLLPLTQRADVDSLSVEYRKRIAAKASGPHQIVPVMPYLDQMNVAKEVLGIRPLRPSHRHKEGQPIETVLRQACGRGGFP